MVNKQQIYGTCLGVIVDEEDSALDLIDRALMEKHEAAGAPLMRGYSEETSEPLTKGIVKFLEAFLSETHGVVPEEVLERLSFEAISSAETDFDEYGEAACSELFPQLSEDGAFNDERFRAGVLITAIAAQNVLKAEYGDFLLETGVLSAVPNLDEERKSIQVATSDELSALDEPDLESNVAPKDSATESSVLSLLASLTKSNINYMLHEINGEYFLFAFPEATTIDESGGTQYELTNLVTTLELMKGVSQKSEIYVKDSVISLKAQL